MYKNLLTEMFVLQDSFNKKVHPDWVNQDYDYDRAIWVEAAELMEHISYKWWKKQTPDIEQATMELVDIFHFGMSSAIKAHKKHTREHLVEWWNEIYQYHEPLASKEFDISNFRSVIDELVHSATSETNDYRFSVPAFLKLWFMLGLDITDLYKQYIGKNALNEFRQLNGYKDGTYIKIWNDKEDNEVLTALLSTAVVDEKLYQTILSALESCYAAIKLTEETPRQCFYVEVDGTDVRVAEIIERLKLELQKEQIDARVYTN